MSLQLLKSHLFILIGGSGVGKNAAEKQIRQKFRSKRPISTTSRERRKEAREGETEFVEEREGIDYYYVDVPTFEKRAAAGYFCEFARQKESPFHYYGKSWDEMRRVMDEPDLYVFDVNIDGFVALREKFPDQVTGIFLEPAGDDMDTMIGTLERRLRTKRIGMSDEVILNRMITAQREIEWAHNPLSRIEHIVKTDDLHELFYQVESIIGEVIGLDKLYARTPD